jgi:type IV pilus assembly protein PilM
MAKKQVSLYIDDTAIHVLVSRGRQPQKWASMPLEPGLVKEGLIQNEAAVAAKLNELWESLKIDSRKVIAAISGLKCLYNLLTLPEVPRELLPEAIKREASRVLGISLEEVYLSWQVLYLRRGETLVYLAASPRSEMEALIATLHLAGLDPYLMDIKPLCLARAATEPKAIIVDTHPDSFDIIILAEGIPQVARSVSFSEEVTAEEKIQAIREELDRAIAFYNSAHMDKPIDPSMPLLVSGELAQQEDAWHTLSGRQRRPVQVLGSPMETPADFAYSQYLTNIGLALKEVLIQEKGAIAYSLVDFNALPETYQPKPRELSEVLFLPIIFVGVALLIAGIVFNILINNQNNTLSSDLAAIEQQAASEGVTKADIDTLNQEVSAVEGYSDALFDLLGNFAYMRDEINGDLAEITYSLPDGVDLQDISIGSGDTITVSGMANGAEAVFTYASRLRAGQRFSNVIPSVVEGDQGTAFSLALTKIVVYNYNSP